MLDRLTVRRRFARSAEPHLGFEAEVPAQDLPSEPPAEGAARDQLGWAPPVPPGSSITTVRAVGLLEPTAWERGYVAWLATMYDAEVERGWDVSPALRPDSVAARAPRVVEALTGLAPLGPRESVPSAVVLQRAASSVVEARHAVAQLRRWLMSLPEAERPDAADRALVLLPDDPERTRLWVRELDRAELPVRATTAAPLAGEAFARWLVALARLAGWSNESPRGRGLIEQVFGSRFWSAVAARKTLGLDPGTGLSRPRMAAAVAKLRRPTVTLGAWCEHLEHLEAQAAARTEQPWLAAGLEGWGLLSRAVAEVLADGDAACLRRLVDPQPGEPLPVHLGVRGLTSGASPVAPSDVSSAALAVLDALERQEAAGEACDGPGDPDLPRRLEDALASLYAVETRLPEHGVTLMPYGLYDGRSSSQLVLAGLEEGGYPSVPPLPSAREEQWLDALYPEREPGTERRAELERQVRVVLCALEQCSGQARLSFSRQGTGTEDRHPGPLLSLLVGSWKTEDWRRVREGVVDLQRSREVPSGLDEAESWADVRLLAQRPEVREALGAVAASEPRAASLGEAWTRLAATREATAAREPNRGGAEPGPWTGRLPGPAQAPGPHSPTALEDYGQCGTQYFLRRVLKVSDAGDSGEEPDPREMGTLVHSVFAQATWQAVDIDGPTLLDFDVSPEDPRGVEGRVDDLHAAMEPILRRSLGDSAGEHPTFSGPLLEALAVRWSQALRIWLQAQVREATPWQVETAGLDTAPAAARLLQDLSRVEAQRSQLPPLRAAAEAGEITTQKLWTAFYRSGAGFIQAQFLDCYRAWKAGSSLDEALAPLEPLFAAREDLVAKKLEIARADERRRREDAIDRRAAHAELSFGLAPEPRDGEDPMSTAAPAQLEIEGVKLEVKGQIDRVDWDANRETLAIRDYKSGAKTSVSKLLDKTRRGLSLQLLLYAEALEAVIERGDLPHLAGHHVSHVALEFPKAATPRSSGAELGTATGSGLALPTDGDPSALDELDLRQLGRLWIAGHVSGVEAGHFDLLPEACPKVENGARCDYDRVCGFRPAFADRFVPRSSRPTFDEVPPPPGEERKPKKPNPVLPPKSDLDLSPDDARAAHEAACAVIADPDRDVVVSAGAGTGKTWNLVRRYAAALRGGQDPDPQSILCVTFTRRAAGEMRQRIRAALLEEDGAQQAFDADTLRGLVLELSAAPISTLDALTLRIVQERDDHAQLDRPADVSDPSAVRGELKAFVAERFLGACDEGDPDLRQLLASITVSKLREALTEAVEADLAGTLGTADSNAIEAQWRALVEPLLARAAEGVDGLDIAAGRDALARTKSIQEEPALAMEGVFDGAERLQGAAAPGWEGRLEAIRALWSRPAKKNVPEPLKGWYSAELIPRLAGFEAGLSSADKKVFSELRKSADFSTWASLVAAGARLAGRWAREFDELLRSRGTLRYSDVEQLALEALRTEDEGLRHHLQARLPFAHVFVDESQDTSERQVELVQALRDLCGARLFWVGDPKQSIYRFRGAEVDVFERLVREAGEDTQRLRTNRRSRPALIRAVNRLFGALLPALRDGVPLDPGSEVPYSPLTWTLEEDDGGKGPPAIELIASPGARWGLPEAEEEEEEDEKDGDGDDGPRQPPAEAEPTDLERAICLRIARLAKSTQTHDGPAIAVLVHSWARAERYRALLSRSEFDVAAAVQGGRGLLSAPEVEGVVHWLEAAQRRSDLGLVGALRGPGISLSDPGLLCLRRGWGLRAVEGKAKPEEKIGLRRAATSWRLDPKAAAEDWAAATPLDRASLEATLAVDVGSLEAFRTAWSAFGDRLARGSLAAAVEALLLDLELEGWWLARPGGRQAVANLWAFVHLLRETEASLGTDGPAVLRALEATRDSDDPAAGGLDAGDSAAVVITTFWQAKGLEWPIVVLPDLHKTSAKGDASALGAVRILDPATGEPTHVAELKVTSPSHKPFATHPTVLGPMLDCHRKPAARAELRRLLYVAMTRPEQRLVLSGVFSAPSDGKACHVLAEKTKDTPAVQAMSLDTANSWADTLMVCTGLSFDDEGAPRLGPGVWTAADAIVRSAAAVLEEELEAKVKSPPPAVPAIAGLLPRWSPLPSAPIAQIRPSDAGSTTVPPPLGAPQWPANEDRQPSPFGAPRHEGTAFHLLMEFWGFGAGEAELGRDLAREALEQLDLAPHPRQEERITRLLSLVARAEADQPVLFDRLRAAAAAGDLLHEVPLRFLDASGRHVTGKIDLVWREGGAWHVLDYKAGWKVPTPKDGLKNSTLRKHHGQVELYREGMRALLPGATVATTGIWYVSRGLVVQWG